MFSYPSYFWRRALHLTKPMLAGEDVYALQIALNFVVPEAHLTTDGIFGKATAEALAMAQRLLALDADGVAGPMTQRGLALRIGNAAKQQYPLVKGLPGGQMQHESGFFLGAYSPMRNDGSYDVGVTQRNTAHTPAQEGFDPVVSIRYLCKTVKEAYDRYSGVSDSLQRWRLAAGSWNAPAYTNYLAGKVQPYAVPSATAKATLDAYMDSVCAFVRL